MSHSTATNAREERLFLGIVMGLALVTGIGSWLAVLALKHHERPDAIAVDQPRVLVDFTLTDRTGRPVTRAEVQGKVLVVSFLFTSCSLTCPEVSRRMADIQRLTDGQPDVRLLSLTVDPRTDTTNTLAKWGDRYGAETNRWYLLTGGKPELYRLIATSFLKQDNTDPFNSMPGNFAGTERIALVDRHGRTRAFYDGLSPQTPDAIADHIRELLAEP